MKIKLLLLTSLLALSACGSNETIDSSKVSQSEIWQGYSLRYDGSNSMLQNQAEFRVSGNSGTTVELNSPSKVSADGSLMTKKRSGLVGTFYYRSDAARAVTQTHSWSYMDSDGKEYRNQAILEPLSVSNYLGQRVSRNTPFIVGWAGAPVQPNETVTIAVSQDQSGIRKMLFGRTTNVGQNSVTVSADEMHKLIAGNASFTVERSRSIPAQQAATPGGQIIIDFETASVDVQIVE